MSGMRIAFYGNICNNFYQIAKALRKQTDLDVHLFIDDRADAQQMPESDDPQLSAGYPSWIHRKRYITAKSLLAPSRSRLVRDLDEFDLVILSGIGPSFAPFLKAPAAFMTAGGDLTMLPFTRRFLFSYSTLNLKLYAVFAGWRQRRGIRHCAEIWTQPFAPFVAALEALGIPETKVTNVYFPVLVDTERLKPVSDVTRGSSPGVREVTEKFDFVVFHPSRMMIDDRPALRASGQWKRNDLLIQAFAAFATQPGRERAGLVMIDRPAGPDINRAKELIRELQIEKQVLWLRPEHGYGFTRDQLISLYSVADVVADDFGVGWFGSIVLEALSIGKPVISHVDAEVMVQLYPWHPILSECSVEGIAAVLTRLATDRSFHSTLSARGREWIEEFHSEANAGRIYVRQVLGAVQRSRHAATEPRQR